MNVEKNQIRFRDILWGAIAMVLEYKTRLLKALIIPAFLVMIIDTASVYSTNSIGSVLLLFLTGLTYTLFAITIHRIILLGSSSVAPWGVLQWSKREMSFLVYLIALIAICIIPATLFGLIAQSTNIDYGAFMFFIGIAVTIVLAWLVGRLSLVFPAIAVEDEASFSRSWQLTSQYQFIMSLVVVIFPIVIGIPSSLVAALPAGGIFISIFLNMLAAVFTISALSIAYKKII